MQLKINILCKVNNSLIFIISQQVSQVQLYIVQYTTGLLANHSWHWDLSAVYNFTL